MNGPNENEVLDEWFWNQLSWLWSKLYVKNTSASLRWIYSPLPRPEHWKMKCGNILTVNTHTKVKRLAYVGAEHFEQQERVHKESLCGAWSVPHHDQVGFAAAAMTETMAVFQIAYFRQCTSVQYAYCVVHWSWQGSVIPNHALPFCTYWKWQQFFFFNRLFFFFFNATKKQTDDYHQYLTAVFTV